MMFWFQESMQEIVEECGSTAEPVIFKYSIFKSKVQIFSASRILAAVESSSAVV